jgi:hypothetical protein
VRIVPTSPFRLLRVVVGLGGSLHGSVHFGVVGLMGLAGVN